MKTQTITGLKYDREPKDRYNLIYPDSPLFTATKQDVGHLEICLDRSHYAMTL